MPRRKDRSKRVSYYDGGGHNTLYMLVFCCFVPCFILVFHIHSYLRCFVLVSSAIVSVFIVFHNHSHSDYTREQLFLEKKVNFCVICFRSKCICLLTRLPFVVSTTSILKAFHHLITNCTEAVPLPLESYIFWLLNEVPLPSPGTTLKVRFTIYFYIFNSHFEFFHLNHNV